MEYGGFGKKSGPSSSTTNPNSSNNFFTNAVPSPPNPSSSTMRSPRPFVPSNQSFGDGPRPFGHSGVQSHRQRPSSSSPMVTSIVASRSSENSVSLKVSRSQPESSGGFNQSVSMRNNPSPGGFRPSSVGVVPIRQSVRAVEGYRPSVGAQHVRHQARPRNNSPELASRRNQFVDLDTFHPPPVGAGPVRYTARPRLISPESASLSNQFVDLDSFPPLSVGAGPIRQTARPRSISPESASVSNQFVDLDSFPPLSVGAGPGRHTARPRYISPEPASISNQFVDLDSFPPLSVGARSVGHPARPRPISPESAFVSNQFVDLDSFPPLSVGAGPVRSSFIQPPELGTISNVTSRTRDLPAPQKSLPHASSHVPEAAATNPTSFPAMKRSRSPPVSSNKGLLGKFNNIQDDEREMLAKAKRSVRFKVELGEKSQSNNDDIELKVSTNLHEPSIVGSNKLVSEHSTEMNDDFSSELEGSRVSGVIIGLCTDMCPESERAERERKGDLDRFERLDGDRNQTSKHLAVKKYTRTAEREANLIRPMPILQKTMEYLLNLLDQPYDDKFLGTYNFLWDRMRAIRMDLRMQHIFNQTSITMLEQMIRLHIIAMHELCEYSKGEGFSEGFDAHLNIEQMNKTSVELFQMYDDHRKKGIIVRTEEEFRGYYALLKLDKHPGYMVEPGELSLDLAKMTPEIRQTKEVLFARDVARACRTGNFIAFFRLARKASYLQACLMHAHFAKLRTQALASLHAGLQNNQGLPVIHVSRWLAMEEEDMESLLEYHGFLIKVFDEPYMVKDGPFLNGEKDYNTTCSKLVDMKKSGSILEDVVPSTEVTSRTKAYQSLGKKIIPTKAPKEMKMARKNDELEVFPSDRKKRSVHDIFPIEVYSPVYAVDEDMVDSIRVPSPKDFKVTQPTPEIPVPTQQHENGHQSAEFNPFSWEFSLPKPLPSLDTPHLSFSPGIMNASIAKPVTLQVASKPMVQDSLLDTQSSFVVEKPVPQASITEMEEEQPPVLMEEIENEGIEPDYEEEEIAKAKLKLIIRSWKRRASRKRELREQKQLAANAALNSLPLGPLIQLKREPLNALDEFDIDHALRERYKKHERSMSRLNVSEEIAGILSRENPASKCLCWKIIVCSQASKPDEVETGQSADSPSRLWLLSKIMPSNKDDDNDLLISSPGLSIWKKWVSGQFHSDPTCCLSIVKDANFNNPTETMAGASAVLFLVCYSIPWSVQKANLQRLLESIPSGSCLPLLIVSSSIKDEATDNSSIVVDELGLLNIDKSKLSSFVVVSLTENQQTGCSDGFFSDKRLREGLRWLASESRSQLVLHRAKTRELVLTRLSPSLEALEGMKDTEVNPNDCILAFNEALDWSLACIDAGAKANPTGWPCPEISLLDESSPEHRYLERCIPELGWSSVDRIGPLVSALHDCKFPLFKDDLSYLSKGSNTVGDIEIQRDKLWKSLIRYLTESSKMMRHSLAVKEAGIMLQSCRLELRGSLFYIVPIWATIFRRIFHWRLTSIANEASSSAYILEPFNSLDDLSLEGTTRFSSYHLNQPTLDEMIEVSFGPTPSGNSQQPQEADHDLYHSAPNGKAQVNIDADLVENDSEAGRECRPVNPDNGIREVVVAAKVDKEADRLSKLLEKCNIVQNMLDDKLSVYF